MIIDGREGEGGGQILRSSLSLSLIKQTPFTLENVRGNRKKPGLKRQHLTCVKAAKEIGFAETEGDELNSMKLYFSPQGLNPGNYRFSVGSAGSCNLVLQSVLPALLTVDSPTHIQLEGGTHNSMSPAYDFLKDSFLPQVKKMGADVNLEIERHGFVPNGGGIEKVHINPPNWQSYSLTEKGKLLRKKVEVVISELPDDIPHRAIKVIGRKLNIDDCSIIRVNSPGPGLCLLIKYEYENVTFVAVFFGQRGIKMERIANQAVKYVERYLKHDAPVGEYLADQLLMSMAISGNAEIRCTPLSLHTTTNINIIEKFMGKTFDLKEYKDGSVVIKTV